MKCVVDGNEVDEPHYANPGENARKLYPCCSAACAAKFDPDVHWMPAVQPKLADMPEEARLLKGARDRIRAGDKPSLIVRDMLIAGCGIPGVRKLLNDGEATARVDQRNENRAMFMRLLFGVSMLFRSPKQTVEGLQAANADIEAWHARFGRP